MRCHSVGYGMMTLTVANAIGYAQHCSRSHHAVIRVYDEAGNVIKRHDLLDLPTAFTAQTHGHQRATTSPVDDARYGVGADGETELVVMSVSYTHLTLPTNREV